MKKRRNLETFLGWFSVSILLFSVLAGFFCSVQYWRTEDLKSDIRPTFMLFESLINDQNFEEAYLLMTDDYRSRSTLKTFSSDFNAIAKLNDNWTVIQTASHETRVFCNGSGGWLPTSNIIYGMKLEDESWKFTGTKEMWLD